MKRIVGIWLIVVGAMIVAPGLAAQSVGGGLSFWVPESLYLGRGGSVGVESALGTSVGFGERASLPFGIVYNKVYGLIPEGTAAGTAPDPWFVADTLLAYAMAQVRLPIGPLYVDLFGGGAGVWNMTLVPLAGAVESALAGSGEAVAFDGAPIIEGGQFGWGWQAGGGVGVQAGPVAVDVNVTYRLLKSPATISGTYYRVDTAGPAVSGATAWGSESIMIRLSGFSVGVSASFDM